MTDRPTEAPNLTGDAAEAFDLVLQLEIRLESLSMFAKGTDRARIEELTDAIAQLRYNWALEIEEQS